MITEELKQRLIEFKKEVVLPDSYNELLEIVFNTNNLNAQGDLGMTLLHSAIENENYELTKLLLENKIDVNIQNKLGVTALMLAVNQIEANLEIIKLLICYNSDINTKCDYTFRTALGRAKVNKAYEIIALLENAEQIRQEFLRTHEEQKEKTLEELIEEDKTKTSDELLLEAKEILAKKLLR